MTQWGLETLFNPAKRHVEEEKRRLESTREEIRDSSGGQRIDLESGKVTIKRHRDPTPAAAVEEPPTVVAKKRKRRRAEPAESPDPTED
jgi:Family of unknown function (DUF6191)